MKAKKRTTKKAVTLLTRIEGLLSDVVDECSAIEKSVEKNVRLLLRSADAAVTVAKDFFLTITPAPAKTAHKVAKAKKRVVRHRAARPAAKPVAAAHRRAARPAARKRAVAKPLAAPAAVPPAAIAAL